MAYVVKIYDNDVYVSQQAVDKSIKEKSKIMVLRFYKGKLKGTKI